MNKLKVCPIIKYFEEELIDKSVSIFLIHILLSIFYYMETVFSSFQDERSDSEEERERSRSNTPDSQKSGSNLTGNRSKSHSASPKSSPAR